jgi:CarD family transcriptional regulator
MKENTLTSKKQKKAKKAPAAKAVKKPVAKKSNAAPKKPAPKTIQKVVAKRLPEQKPVLKVEPRVFEKPVLQTKPVAIADNDNIDFDKGDMVVYPVHGVGQIEGVETQTIGGMQIRLYAISFEKERMRLKIPVIKAKTSGLRKLCSSKRLKDAIETLQGRARVRRTMWSRRAQEYETKINSGDPIAIAEVLRDLKRSNDDSEQSYSERQIYQSALERLAREFAAIKKITEIKATEQLEDILGTNKKKEAA